MIDQFITHETDSVGVEALQVLQQAGYGTSVLRDGQRPVKHSVAVFGNSSLVRGGCSVRVAAHRLRPFAPKWAEGAAFFIAVETVHQLALTNAARLLQSSSALKLTRFAPWGELPSSAEHFQGYREWFGFYTEVDADVAGLVYRPPTKLPPRVRNTLRRQLNDASVLGNLGNQGYTDDVIQSVQSARALLDPARGLESVSVDTGFVVRAIKMLKEQIIGNSTLFLLEGGSQMQFVCDCLWRARYGNRIEILVPVCPAWSHDETGYTFETVYGDRGLAYDTMIERLVVFTNFLRSLNLPFHVTILVGDVEWFDIAAGDYLLKEQMDEAEFMRRVATQAGLIREDLARRQLAEVSEVCGFLDALPREEFLAERAYQHRRFEEMLQASPWVMRYFPNLLQLEAPMYAKQCRLKEPTFDPHNPPLAVREAAIDDISLYLTFVELLRQLIEPENVCFFAQSDPFAQLYRSTPCLCWKCPRQGAF